jgi:hypothetical protein
VHGEPAAQEWMQQAIAEAHEDIDVRRPEWGDLIDV